MTDMHVIVVALVFVSLVWAWVYDRRYAREYKCVQDNIALQRAQARQAVTAAQAFNDGVAKLAKNQKPPTVPGDEWKDV